MNGVNKVILLGTCGKDPEIRYTPGGSAVTNVSIATSEKWKDKQTGELKEDTEWHRVVFFGRLAEIAGEYLRKGSPVYVEGKNKTRSWEKDGITRYSTDIIGREMQMLGKKPDNSGSSAPASNGNQAPGNTTAAPAASQAGGFDDFDDDIPF